MQLAKLKFFIKKNLNFSNIKLSNLGFSFNKLFSILLILSLTLVLSINILNVYDRGRKNLEQIDYEQGKLNELTSEGEELKKQVEYYKSAGFIEAFARENFSFGKSGEKLYKIDDEETQEVYNIKEKNTDPILLDDNLYWWKTVFLW